MTKRICTIEGCERASTCRGLCGMHYSRWRRHGDPLVQGRIVGNDRVRFNAKWIEGPVPDYAPALGPCWIWTGGRIGLYGGFWLNGHGYAHRAAYTLFIGPIPVGLQLDHLCRVTLCVNPKHLEPVTRRVNLLRGFGIVADEARRTHCPKGHPYDEANTIRRRGQRECRTCAIQYQRDLRARRRK